MTTMDRQLDDLIDSYGLKVVVAGLADLCARKARQMTYGWQGDMHGLALDWQHDCISLRQCLMRLKSSKPVPEGDPDND